MRTFSLRTREAEAGRFGASLIYRMGSRTARTTQRNPVLENKTKQTKSIYSFYCSMISFSFIVSVTSSTHIPAPSSPSSFEDFGAQSSSSSYGWVPIIVLGEKYYTHRSLRNPSPTLDRSALCLSIRLPVWGSCVR